MTLEIRPGITVRRPRREVAAVIFNPRYDESWMETLRPVDPEDVEPQNGADQPRLIRFLLRDVVVWLRETSREPGRFVEFEAEDPYKLWIRQDLESIPEGTLVRMRIRVALTGLPRLLSPLVYRRLRRSVIGDLEALKALVENSPHRGMAAARPAEPPAEAAGPGPAAAESVAATLVAVPSVAVPPVSTPPPAATAEPPSAPPAPATAQKASATLASAPKLAVPLKPARRPTTNW